MNGTRSRLDRILAASVWVHVPMAVVCLVGSVIDDRTVDGHSVWTKPAKFAISIGLAGATVIWLRRHLTPTRTIDTASIAFVAAMAGEQVLITVQAARGVRSHFNLDTPFDAMVFQVMGALITVAFLALLAMAVGAVRHPPDDPIVSTVCRHGTWLVMAGSAVGILMSGNGAHAVGGSDADPGLPLSGWSTTHGDLRPAHFVGLHSLQALVAVAAVAGVLQWPSARTTSLLSGVSSAVAATVVGLTAQALLGHPVTSWGSLGILAAAVAMGFAAGPTGSGDVRPYRRR